jgi:hypothetical protein
LQVKNYNLNISFPNVEKKIAVNSNKYQLDSVIYILSALLRALLSTMKKSTRMEVKFGSTQGRLTAGCSGSKAGK